MTNGVRAQSWPPTRSGWAHAGVDPAPELLATVAERLPIGMVVLEVEDRADPGSFRIVFANTAADEAARAPVQSYVGTTLAESFPEILQGGRQEACRTAIDADEVRDLPPLRYGDDTIPEAVFAVQAVPVSDTCLVILFTNVTEQESAERVGTEDQAGDLATVNAELEVYASLAAHDLQEPLRKMLMFSELTITEFSDHLDERGIAHLGRIRSAAGRMQALVHNLLEYWRLSAAKIVRAEVDLNDAIHTAVARLDRQIDEAGATIEIGALPTIEAERVGIEQLFQNLIANAIKYRSPETAPTIRVHEEDEAPRDVVRIVVEDDGIGFEAQHAERIFQMGERLHGRSRFEGSGLGLALVRRIADRHHGEVTAESEPGTGSRFIVTLPRSHATIRA